jgi:hypothetical protein
MESDLRRSIPGGIQLGVDPVQPAQKVLHGVIALVGHPIGKHPNGLNILSKQCHKSSPFEKTPIQ